MLSEDIAGITAVDQRRIPQLTEPRIQNRGRHVVASSAKVAERQRIRPQLPKHAQCPPPTEEIQCHHQRPPGTRTASGTPRLG